MEGIVVWFVDVMESKFNLHVLPEEVSYEGCKLYHEEIDESFIPKEHMDVLPDPLLFDTMFYADEEGNEWIAGIVVEESSREWLYTVWLKNGETVSYKFLKQEEGE